MADTSETFNWLVRLGYFARAVLYTLLGVVALTTSGQISKGAQGVYRTIEDYPAGTALLWILAIGLFGYALFRLASTLFDIENHGSDKTGIAERAGHFGSAIGHLLLAYSAYRVATGSSGGSEGGRAQEAAAGVMSFEFGAAVVGLLGLAFVAAAFFQAKKGLSGAFMRRISPRAPDATRWLGGAGYVARAVVFAVIGWSLIRSAWFGNTAEVVTLGGAIASLGDGGIWFTLVAIGLLLFGIFSLVLARYRIIPEMDMHRHVPRFRA
ncbi:MAG: DUF1206 domain-containing protein [Porphyrobacter sp.]|nr:DUF1206 domain-containing protein [Porphyrobacter sp.]